MQLKTIGGFEIIPHGVQPETSTRAQFEEALDYMKRNFDSVSWIDHSMIRRGYVSGGHDGFLAFGLVEGSKHYRADLWRSFGFRYFWNHALEYKEVVPRVPPAVSSSPKPSLSSIIKHKIASFLPVSIRDAIRERLRTRAHRTTRLDLTLDQLAVQPSRPVPLWWRHPSATGDFVNWATRANAAAYFREGDGSLMRLRLDGLVANWGVDLHHCYPTRVDATNGAWRRNAEGRFVVSPEFDDALAYMARLRDQGKLYVGVVRDIVAHWITMEGLRVEPKVDGTTVLRNVGDVPIRALTLAARGRERRIEGVPATSREADDETILSFDLGPGEIVTVI